MQWKDSTWSLRASGLVLEVVMGYLIKEGLLECGLALFIWVYPLTQVSTVYVNGL